MRFATTYLIALLLPASLYSQTTLEFRNYSTVSHNRQLVQDGLADPGFRSVVSPLLSSLGRPETWDEVTIPVVFNVLHTTADKSISIEQIIDQLDRLNEDFSGLAMVPEGDGRENTVPGDTDLQSDSKIRFCFADLGLLRNAINYRVVDTSIVKGITQITNPLLGLPAILPDNHLNIWILPRESGQPGFAQFPGGPESYDGIVIGEDYFGIKNDPTLPFSQGRTLTHLVGNYLGLLPIWGQTSCGDDGVSDTPIHNGPNIGKPGVGHYSLCPGTPLEMTMNFMDSCDDDHLYSFTPGQIKYMRAVLDDSGPRGGILAGLIECTTNPVTSQNTTHELDNGKLDKSTIISLFPNPAINDVKIVSLRNGSKFSSIVLYDLNGREVNVSGNLFGVTEHRINTSNLNPGIYFIRIRLTNGETVTKRLGVN